MYMFICIWEENLLFMTEIWNNPTQNTLPTCIFICFHPSQMIQAQLGMQNVTQSQIKPYINYQTPTFIQPSSNFKLSGSSRYITHLCKTCTDVAAEKCSSFLGDAPKDGLRAGSYLLQFAYLPLDATKSNILDFWNKRHRWCSGFNNKSPDGSEMVLFSS